METNEISIHLIKVFKHIEQAKGWVTIKDTADATGVRPRTVHQHIHRMVKLGVLDLAEVFPRHRYKLSEMADKRNLAFVTRIKKAIAVFGDDAA